MKNVQNFDAIRQIVMEDSSLMAALVSAGTQTELFGLVIALARERGIELTVADLQEIVRANRKAWLERWLVP